jgi:hypothetical protein
MKIGFFGSCQLHLCVDFFLNDEIKKKNNIVISFNIPFYIYDNKYHSFKKELIYNIFDDIDCLIIENNKLNNSASSEKIINYCQKKNIKIIKTFLIKFPIYPINWSGYGENTNDYINWIDLDKINYKDKFEKCINSCKQENLLSDLSIDISTFIENNFSKQLLFTHSLHPTNILLFELWKNIFEKIPIDISNYNYIFKNELIQCWYNPFTSKMVCDLDIKFNVVIDDIFYISRYNKNIKKLNN